MDVLTFFLSFSIWANLFWALVSYLDRPNFCELTFLISVVLFGEIIAAKGWNSVRLVNFFLFWIWIIYAFTDHLLLSFLCQLHVKYFIWVVQTLCIGHNGSWLKSNFSYLREQKLPFIFLIIILIFFLLFFLKVILCLKRGDKFGTFTLRPRPIKIKSQRMLLRYNRLPPIESFAHFSFH